MLENFMIVGHRGFRSQYPENTIPSFLAAMDYGLDSLEFDVHPTKDRKLVVTHDHTVERCSNGKGYVHDFLFDDIPAKATSMTSFSTTSASSISADGRIRNSRARKFRHSRRRWTPFSPKILITIFLSN